MDQRALSDRRQWALAVKHVREELGRLAPAERLWMEEHLKQVQQLQGDIHAFFDKAQGGGVCAGCHGACCEKGRHHLTLVNLLGFLVAGQSPPEPDFSLTCPFLGPKGCRLEPARRPFNCVTFNCEAIEERLCEEDRSTFYRLEKELRALYQKFDSRYAGSSLRGLLIRAERLAGRPFLQRP